MLSQSFIASLDRSTAIELAETFEQTARRLRARASYLEAREQDRREGRFVFAKVKAGAWRAALEAGALDPGRRVDDDALEAASKAAGVQPLATRSYVVQWRREAAAEVRARRNLEIMRLVARGWTNAQIAGRVGLSPAYVGRIVRKMIALGSPAPAPSAEKREPEGAEAGQDAAEKIRV